MKDISVIDSVIRHLHQHYYGNIIVLAVLFILVLLRIIPFPESILSVGITMERYAIIVTIIAIPAALKLFAYRLKEAPRPLEEDKAATIYTKLFYMRIYILSTITFMNIVLLGFSRNSNFLWLTVVLLIIFFFCKPSSIELTGLSELPQPEATMESEQESATEQEQLTIDDPQHQNE